MQDRHFRVGKKPLLPLVADVGYACSDLLDSCWILMQKWADIVTGKEAKSYRSEAPSYLKPVCSRPPQIDKRWKQ